VTGRRLFGVIDELPSGRYRARYRHMGKRWSAPHTFAHKKPAGAWLDGESALIDSGRWTPPKDRPKARGQGVTVAEWCESVIDTKVKAGEIDRRTPGEYRSYIANRIRPAFGDVPLAALTPSMVRDLWTSMAGVRSMRVKVYSFLNTCMKLAVDASMIESNPCQIVNASKGKGKRKGKGKGRKLRILEVSEIEIIAKSFPPAYAAAVHLASWMGPRFGEFTELRRRDVDLWRDEDGEWTGVLRVERGSYRLRKSEVAEGASTLAVGPTKTEDERENPIPPHIAAILVDHLREYVGPGRDALLFPAVRTPTNNLAASTFRRWWVKGVTAAGREDLTPHAMRHTTGTRFIQQGGTWADVMDLLGHSTNSAAQIYQHTADSRMKEMAKRMSEAARAGK
jgi:integrase